MPVPRLVVGSGDARRTGQHVTVGGDLAAHVRNSVVVAGLATIVCLGAGLVLAWTARRRGAGGQLLGRIATLGYAVPGPVVAVGVVITLAALDRQGWLPAGAVLVGSMVGLVYALTVRFLAVGYNGVEASLSKVPGNVIAGARVLGARSVRVVWRIEVPLIRAGLVAAAALVAIDTLKELPITLLLRPFGTDTLSVWVWQATSESLWVQAAVPSLAIVAVGMVPVTVLLWSLEHGATVTS